MRPRNSGIATIVAAIAIIVVMAASATVVLYESSQVGTTTTTSTSTSTVTQPPMTETTTTTLAPVTITTVSTATSTITGPATTTTVTGPTTTSTATATKTVTSGTTVTSATTSTTTTTSTVTKTSTTSSPPVVAQSGSSDCVDETVCAVGLDPDVSVGDILLVFVPGYSPNAGWQVQSVTDSLGNTFVQYQTTVWQSSTTYFIDDAFYAIVTKGSAPDNIVVSYTSEAQHSDPIVLDVTGPNLSIYSGNAADCASSCTTSIATPATPVTGGYLAAAAAYGGNGGTVSAGTGWTPVQTEAYFMTGEYSTDVGAASTSFPFTTGSTPTGWGDVGIVVVSSSSSTSTSSSTTSTSSTACSTSTSTESLNNTVGIDLVQLAQAFSGMSVSYGENTTSGPVVVGDTYSLLYVPHPGSDTYKFSLVETYEGFSIPTTAWIQSDGNLLAIESGGQNVTGSAAQDDLLIYAAPFVVIADYASSSSSIVPSSGFEATGQSTVTLGNVTMTVTNYQPESLPLVYSDCSGDTFTLSTFIVQAGTVPGTNFTLLTYLDYQGVEETSGTSQPLSIYFQVTSITLE